MIACESVRLADYKQLRETRGIMKRHPVLISLVLIVLNALPAAGKGPNFLVIYTDDVGYGDVSCYKGCDFKTPNIDRIAAEGLRFTDAHCTAATCTPSRYTLLTGSYAFRNKRAKILRGSAALIIDPKMATLPKVLQKAGYSTGVVGKWHLGLGEGNVNWNAEVKPGPREVGFGYHFLIPATGDRTPCVYLEEGRVVGLDPKDPIAVSYGKRIGSAKSGSEARDTLKMDWSHGHNSTIVNGISRIGWMTGGHKARWVDEDMADVITRKAVDFIGKNKDKPFFLFYSTHDIHVPRVPHRRFVGKSGTGPRGDAMVQTDWCVGELLKALEKNGLTDNTMVILSSDNGPVLGDGYKDDANEKLGKHDPNGPFRAGKYSKFEGGTRVPFIVKWPGKIKPGETTPALFGQVDLAKTLCMIVEAEIPDGAFVDSRDAGKSLLGRDPLGRAHLIHEAGGLALRQGQWKFIPAGGTRDQLGPWVNVKIPAGGSLYDLSNDLGERRNVAAKNTEKLAEMKALLQKLRESHDG